MSLKISSVPRMWPVNYKQTYISVYIYMFHKCQTVALDSYTAVIKAKVSNVVVVLLFYVHGKHLRSCQDGQLISPHFSWAGLDLLSG